MSLLYTWAVSDLLVVFFFIIDLNVVIHSFCLAGQVSKSCTIFHNTLYTIVRDLLYIDTVLPALQFTRSFQRCVILSFPPAFLHFLLHRSQVFERSRLNNVLQPAAMSQARPAVTSSVLIATFKILQRVRR
jgi:hypothetical protein